MLKRIIDGIVLGAGGAVVSKAILTIFNIIIARILSVEDYGAYSLINNTVQTFTIFAGAGLGVTLTRYVALYREKNKELAGSLIFTLICFSMVTSLIIGILVFIFADNIAILLNSESNITGLLKITAFTIFFTAVVSILQGTLQGFESYKNIAILQIICNIANAIIGIILSKFFGIVGAIYSLLFLQILLFIFMTANLFSNLRKSNIKLKLKINDTIKEAIAKVAIPSFLATVFVLPIMWITNFYFSSNVGLEEFAVFSVCLQWFNIINYIPQQFGQLKPIYTQLYDDKKYKEMRKYNNKIIIITVLFSIICTIVFILGRNIILNAYGDYYKEYTEAFCVMIVTTILFAIQSQYGSVFQAIGKSWLCFGLNIVWALSYIISFFSLYNKGVIGYAYTYFISYFVYALISTIAFHTVIKREERKNNNEKSNYKNDDMVC